tara:strand:- start:769 stop:1341 length:573 start_codon:yes stop_codon:yes gene_type:complete
LNGANTILDQAKLFLKDEAQSLETRYRPRSKDDNEPSQLVDWDLSNTNIAQIVSRCRDFGATGFSSAALSEEQERELAPEIEEERQVERRPKMKVEAHILHADLVRLVKYGHFEGSLTTVEPASKALRCTSPARLFNLQQLPSFLTHLLVTADLMRTVKVRPDSSRATFVSDLYQHVMNLLVVPFPDMAS